MLRQPEHFQPLRTDGVPPWLQSTTRWAPWRLAPSKTRPGKWDKIPCNPRRPEWGLSTQKPEQWGAFDVATAAHQGHPDKVHGVGFCMTGITDLVGLDFDRVTDGQGQPVEWVRPLLARLAALGAHIERSPSGTGLRAFLQCPLDGPDWNHHEVGIEVYGGSAPRFLTVTGQRVEVVPNGPEGDTPGKLLTDLREQYAKAKPEPVDHAPTTEVWGEPAELERLDLPGYARAFLSDGTHDGDRSQRLQAVARCLAEVGLTAGQIQATLCENVHAWGVALDHRNQDAGRAGEYLWSQHVTPALAHVEAHGGPRGGLLDGFEDLTQGAGVAAVAEPKASQPSAEDLAHLMAPLTEQEVSAARLAPREICPGFLYASTRLLVAAGGTGKTTLALFEMMALALGRAPYGQAAPERPMRSVLLTREDNRELLAARLHALMRAQDLTPAERAQVLAHVRIVDLTGRPFRVVEIARDVVQPDRKALAWLVALLQEFAPDWLVLDPAVSLGVGESRVNDAEQGLIESTRVLIAAFDCCVQLVHHSGKAGFREGTTDQYAGRGGSALADGARMVAVLVHVDAADWLKATGTPLAPDESGLALHLPKLSFCPHAPAIYIRRKGWHITHQVVVQPQTPQDANAARAAALLAFLRAEIAQGRRYNAAELDTCAEVLQWSRGELRAARGRLEASGQLAPIGGSGKRGAYLQPVEAMPPPGLACPEGGEFV